MKANLAQRSAGEVALQRNYSTTRGGKKNKDGSGLDHHTEPCKDKGTTQCILSGMMYPFYRTSTATSPKISHCACVLTQFPAPRNNTDHSCFSLFPLNVSYCHFLCPCDAFAASLPALDNVHVAFSFCLLFLTMISLIFSCDKHICSVCLILDLVQSMKLLLLAHITIFQCSEVQIFMKVLLGYLGLLFKASIFAVQKYKSDFLFDLLLHFFSVTVSVLCSIGFCFCRRCSSSFHTFSK